MSEPECIGKWRWRVKQGSGLDQGNRMYLWSGSCKGLLNIEHSTSKDGLVVFEPGAMHPVTTVTIEALTCFCLGFYRVQSTRCPKTNPSHPVCGWSLTRCAQSIYKSAEYLIRRWAFDVRCWTFRSFYMPSPCGLDGSVGRLNCWMPLRNWH